MRINLPHGRHQAPVIALSDSSNPGPKELDAVIKAVSVARSLNDLSPANEFSVIRDPRTGAVIIVVRARATGELINLCPPDAVLDILEHLPGQWKGLDV
jgi:hypothetical protein